MSRQVLSPSRYRLSSIGKMVVILLTGLLWMGLNSTPVLAQVQIYDLPVVSPGESTWVIDQANILSKVNENKISNQLKNLAKETGEEVRLVTLRRLDYGETIDSFTEKIFTTWFPTPAEQVKQTIVALDSTGNNAAIQAGGEAQELLSEDLTASIIKETIGVPLREGNKYNEALLETSKRLVAVLSGQKDPGPPIAQDKLNVESTYASAEETDDRNATIWVVVLLILATIIPMATYFFYQGIG